MIHEILVGFYMHPEKRLIKVLVYKWANLCNPQELSQPTSFFQCSLEEI